MPAKQIEIFSYGCFQPKIEGFYVFIPKMDGENHGTFENPMKKWDDLEGYRTPIFGSTPYGKFRGDTVSPPKKATPRVLEIAGLMNGLN